jgi:hypothetical protein
MNFAEATLLPLSIVETLLPAFKKDDCDEEIFDCLSILKDSGVEQLSAATVETAVFNLLRGDRTQLKQAMKPLVKASRLSETQTVPQPRQWLPFWSSGNQAAKSSCSKAELTRAQGFADATDLPLSVVSLLLAVLHEDLHTELEIFSTLAALRDAGVAAIPLHLVASAVVEAVGRDPSTAPSVVQKLREEQRTHAVDVHDAGYEAALLSPDRFDRPAGTGVGAADGEHQFDMLLEHFKSMV